MTNKPVQQNATDQSVMIRAFTTSTGAPKTDITNATSGLELRYKIGATGAVTTIAPASQTSTGAHTDGGIVHLHAGVYRLDVPDAVTATLGEVTITAAGVSDCTFTMATLMVVAFNPTANNTQTIAEAVTAQMDVDVPSVTVAAAAANSLTASALATDAVTEIANAVVETEWTALKSLSRTGTNGNGGLAITMPNSGAQTSTIAVNTSASPIVDFG